jgi:hypothetical protein
MDKRFKFCPLPRTSEDQDVHCIEEFCAWWIQGEKHPGSCAVTRIAQYLAGILTAVSKQTRGKRGGGER